MFCPYRGGGWRCQFQLCVPFELIAMRMGLLIAGLLDKKEKWGNESKVLVFLTFYEKTLEQINSVYGEL